jgi:hypothetical protein
VAFLATRDGVICYSNNKSNIGDCSNISTGDTWINQTLSLNEGDGAVYSGGVVNSMKYPPV